MRSSLGKPHNISLLNNCEVATGKFSPSIHTSEAIAVSQFCDNPFRTNIITCRDDKLEWFLKEVGGLNLDIRLKSSIEPLPPYFPSLDKESCRNILLPSSIEFIGLTLKDILKTGFGYKAGTFQQMGAITFKEKILHGSLKQFKVILFLTGEDVLIETLWQKR